MMTPAVSFPSDTASTRSTWSVDFVVACLQRLTWRNVALALFIGFPVMAIQQFARNFNLVGWQVNRLKAHPELAVALGPETLAITAQCITGLIGLLAANEAIERGVGPLRANASGVLAGGLMADIVAVLIGAIFHVRVGFRVVGMIGTGVLGDTQPLVLASYDTLNLAFVALAYRRWESMRAAQRRRHRAELARAETRRRAFESSLQAMQARVEPDFLFSTLDLILRRFETHPADASAMLDDLIDYLHAALPHLRETTSTVAKEVALSQAFLNIMRSRGESADTLSTTMTAEAEEASIPPMILLPLLYAFISADASDIPVPNPIGLSAGIVDGSLRLTIEGPSRTLRGDRCDRLLEESMGRLRGLYGKGTHLSIAHHWTDASRNGTRVRLELPYEATDRSHR